VPRAPVYHPPPEMAAAPHMFALVRAHNVLSEFEHCLGRWKYVLGNSPNVSSKKDLEGLEDVLQSISHEARSLQILVWQACLTRVFTEEIEELALGKMRDLKTYEKMTETLLEKKRASLVVTQPSPPEKSWFQRVVFRM
jgi:hypothetical protein